MQRDELCETKLLQDNKVAVLYWLHLKEHTDVLTQGYVGVTTRLIDIRFREHCSKFKSSYNTNNPLHIAFDTYGIDNIVKTRLCVCDVDKAYELEKLFRPLQYMGWNTVEGGKFPSSVIDMLYRKRNAILSR